LAIKSEMSEYKFHFILDGNTPPVEKPPRSGIKRLKSRIKEKLSTKTMIFSRHIYYMDMAQFGSKVIYINQLRDPVDRFISGYNWRRYLAKQEGHIAKSSNETLAGLWVNKRVEDCVLDVTDRECNDFSSKRTRVTSESEPWTNILPSAVPYLCGMAEFCGSATSDRAANQAIRNIDNHYLVVGILEKMEMTLAVFKHLLPDIFKEVNLEDVGHRNHHSNSTGKEMLNPKIRKILQKRLKGEYRVYRHAIQKLENQYKQINHSSTEFTGTPL